MPYDKHDQKHGITVYLKWTKENAVADFAKKKDVNVGLVRTLELDACSSWPRRIVVWVDKE